MGDLWDRLSLICRSKTDSLLNKFENPVETLDMALVDAKKEYAKTLRESGDVFALESKAVDDLQKYKSDCDKWNGIAENAVKAGDDGSATRALEKVIEIENRIAEQEKQVARLKQKADVLRKNLSDMRNSINEAEVRAGEIKADIANTKALERVAKVSDKSAFKQFDRIADKASKDLRVAEAMTDFESDPDKDIEEKYGSTTSAVSNRLEEMKKRLNDK